MRNSVRFMCGARRANSYEVLGIFGFLRRWGACGLSRLGVPVLLELPIGPKVVPFWDYLIEFRT